MAILKPIMKPGKTGISRIIDATRYTLKGIQAAWVNEAAFRQEMILLAIGGIVSLLLPVSGLERVALVGSLLLVIIVELLNSAIEAVVDRIGDEWHELSGRAKDMASAAVFFSLMIAGMTWFVILWEVLVLA